MARGVNGVMVNGGVANRGNSRKSRLVSTEREKLPGMEPLDHYKLNLAEIPFISGQVNVLLSIQLHRKLVNLGVYGLFVQRLSSFQVYIPLCWEGMVQDTFLLFLVKLKHF